MRNCHERAHGPYQHGNRWRVVFVGATGARTVESYASLAEANEQVEAARRVTNARTMSAAVADYLEHLRQQNQTPSSVDTARHRLFGVLRLDEADRQLRNLTPSLARQLVARRAKEVAPDTQRGDVGYASRWATWCVKRGWIAADPFAGIEVTGERSRGKPQLRVDEARRLISTVAADSSLEATAALMALLMGLRAHEIVERTARDLDDGGKLLWIPKSKTRAGVRQLAVPTVLRDRLAGLAAGKGPDERLFGSMSRHALHYHVVRFTELAGVPRVTPHGLRGTFATLSVTAGLPGVAANGATSVADTARMLGHADGGTTMRRHYMAPGAEESAAARRVESLLGTQGTPNGAADVGPVGEDLN